MLFPSNLDAVPHVHYLDPFLMLITSLPLLPSGCCCESRVELGKSGSRLAPSLLGSEVIVTPGPDTREAHLDPC